MKTYTRCEVITTFSPWLRGQERRNNNRLLCVNRLRSSYFARINLSNIISVASRVRYAHPRVFPFFVNACVCLSQNKCGRKTRDTMENNARSLSGIIPYAIASRRGYAQKHTHALACPYQRVTHSEPHANLLPWLPWSYVAAHCPTRNISFIIAWPTAIPHFLASRKWISRGGNITSFA